MVFYLAATAHFFGREFRRTIEIAEQAISIDPGFLPAYFIKSLALMACRRGAEALETAELGVQLAGRVPFMLAPLGGALALAGHRTEARGILNELLERSRQEPVGAHWVAALYASLGEVDMAFTILDRGMPDWGPTYPFSLSAPTWDVVRAHPRFQEIAAKIGCPSLASTRWSFVPQKIRGILVNSLVRSAAAIASARAHQRP